MNKILVIGQGAIGTFLAATLSVGESNITHFVREKTTARNQITLNFNDRRKRQFRLPKGKQYKYTVSNGIQELRSFNQIIVSVSHNEIKNILSFLSPYLHDSQTIVIMGNIWNDFQWIEEKINIPFIFAFPNFGGAIVLGKLEGWLTPNFTSGITIPGYKNKLEEFNSLLASVGYKPRVEKDIKGWLMTHFAYNAGMLLEAGNQDGFQVMTKNIKSLKNMFFLISECMCVVKELGINVESFKEYRASNHPVWWSALKTYCMFLLPGLAAAADASKNIVEWKSYGQRIYNTSQQIGIETPLLALNYKDNNV